MALFCGDFDLYCFVSLILGSVSEDIHFRLGGSDVVPLYRFAIISESWGITFGEISTAGFSFFHWDSTGG